jgi:hypothetical protein
MDKLLTSDEMVDRLVAANTAGWPDRSIHAFRLALQMLCNLVRAEERLSAKMDVAKSIGINPDQLH